MARVPSSVNLELFVASPGDVAKERQIVQAVISELRSTIGTVLGVHIRDFLWEHDLGPGAHPGGPQGLVDENSNLRICDILVGIFWNRLGTPTPDGKTGTEHELMDAYTRWQETGKPHIMLYFSDQRIRPGSQDIDQARLLRDFKRALPPDVLPVAYTATTEFERLFREHLTRHALQVWLDRGGPIDPIRFAGPQFQLGLAMSHGDVVRVNTEIVLEAEQLFFATGSRSRDTAYLNIIEERLRTAPHLIHYRVLMGPPFRQLFKEHLLRMVKQRPAGDRAHGAKTLHIGLFEKPMQQAEVFMAGNEKRVLLVLPSRKALGEYNTALIIDDPDYVKDMGQFVKQLYAASREIETSREIRALKPLLG